MPAAAIVAAIIDTRISSSVAILRFRTFFSAAPAYLMTSSSK
jgi:hypothetical protein